MPLRNMSLLLLALSAFRVEANPKGGVVVAGTASISSSGKTLTVRQTTLQSIINWQSFENAPRESINFQQPAASAVVLNRVVGGNPSFIGGNLSANGRVYLINPNGIVFGPSSTVNVNSLVASSLNISDTDFLRGNRVLVQDPTKEPSSVVNLGRITAGDKGEVVFAAPIVNNAGTIVPPAGRVLLYATSYATVDAPTALNDNRSALGKSVRMAAVGLTPGLRDVVNTSSLVSANQVEVRDDGTVYLRQAGGIALNEGTIRAPATLTRPAGTVAVVAENAISLRSGSRISATGSNITAGSGAVSFFVKGTNSSTDGVRLDYGPHVGGLYYSGPSGPDPATRATVEAGRINVSSDADVVSSPDASLEFKGSAISFGSPKALGTATKPIRVSGGGLSAFTEKEAAFQADGDITVNSITTFGNRGTTLSATGSILARVPSDGSFYVNIESQGPITLSAGGTIGTPDAHLHIFQGVTTPPPPTGPYIDFVIPPPPVLPGQLGTIGVVDPPPGLRPNYAPPGDSAGGVGSGGATIGSRDNVVLSSLRATLVKSDDETTTDAGGLITVARRSDETGDDTDEHRRHAMARKRRR